MADTVLAVPPGGQQREPGRARPAGPARSGPPARPRCGRGQAAPGARRFPPGRRGLVPGLRPVRRPRRAGDRAHRRKHLPRLAAGGPPRAISRRSPISPAANSAPASAAAGDADDAGWHWRERIRLDLAGNCCWPSNWPIIMAAFDLTQPARKGTSGTDAACPAWPGTSVRSPPSASPATSWPACSAATRPASTCGPS